jgi:hypothetical protein
MASGAAEVIAWFGANPPLTQSYYRTDLFVRERFRFLR